MLRPRQLRGEPTLHGSLFGSHNVTIHGRDNHYTGCPPVYTAGFAPAEGNRQTLRWWRSQPPTTDECFFTAKTWHVVQGVGALFVGRLVIGFQSPKCDQFKFLYRSCEPAAAVWGNSEGIWCVISCTGIAHMYNRGASDRSMWGQYTRNDASISCLKCFIQPGKHVIRARDPEMCDIHRFTIIE